MRDSLACWASARDRDHLLACLAYLYATVVASLACASFLLGAPLSSLPWLPVRALPSFGALAALLAQQRRAALAALPSIGTPAEPPSVWAALRVMAARELSARARLAPAMCFAAAVVVREVVALGGGGGGHAAAAWSAPCAPAADAEPAAPPTHECYRAELPLSVLWACACAAVALAGWSEECAGLRWPLLQQSLFLRLRARALPALGAAARGCARGAAALLLCCALAPRATLLPAARAAHWLRLPARARLEAALGGAGGGAAVALVPRAHWLALLAAGLVFHSCWHACVELVGAAYTRRQSLSLQALAAPSTLGGGAAAAGAGAAAAGASAHPLVAALHASAPPLTQHLALLDLATAARLERARRAELFADASGQTVALLCERALAALDGLGARARALERYAAAGGGAAAPAGLSARLWHDGQRALHLALCLSALEGAPCAEWAAAGLAALLAASRAEDRFGTVQSLRLVGRVLEALVRCLVALESKGLAALLPQPRGAARNAGGLARDGARAPPQQRRLRALADSHKPSAAAERLALSHARTTRALLGSLQLLAAAFREHVSAADVSEELRPRLEEVLRGS